MYVSVGHCMSQKTLEEVGRREVYNYCINLVFHQ